MKDDMISRQAALDALGERPVVWSDNDEYTLGERNQYDMDRLAIDTVPSVDAVPVVRCEDCNEYQDVHQWCKLHEVEMQPMDFCSYGGRKNADD